MSPDRIPDVHSNVKWFSREDPKFKVVVCMPAYNEERFVASTVLKCKRYFKNVFVVDDCSQDHTGRMAKRAGAKVIYHRQNQGYGGALRTCFRIGKQEKADCLVIIDSDGQHDANHIPSLVDPIKNGEADLVIGSRFKSKAARKEIPKYRMFGIQTITQVFNLGTNMALTDSQSGYRAYSRKALEEIKITSDKMDASMEILFDAKDAKIKIKEVPVVVRYKGVEGSSEDPMGHGFRVLSNTFKLIRERYPVRFFGIMGILSLLLIIPVIWYSRAYHMPPTGLLPLGAMFMVTFLGIIGSFFIFTGIMLHGVNRVTKKLVELTESKE